MSSIMCGDRASSVWKQQWGSKAGIKKNLDNICSGLYENKTIVRTSITFAFNYKTNECRLLKANLRSERDYIVSSIILNLQSAQ